MRPELVTNQHALLLRVPQAPFLTECTHDRRKSDGIDKATRERVKLFAAASLSPNGALNTDTDRKGALSAATKVRMEATVTPLVLAAFGPSRSAAWIRWTASLSRPPKRHHLSKLRMADGGRRWSFRNFSTRAAESRTSSNT